MATQQIVVTENYQQVASGPALLQVLTTATMVYVHFGMVAPANNTIHHHKNDDFISYPGSENMYVRSHSGRCNIAVTQVG